LTPTHTQEEKKKRKEEKKPSGQRNGEWIWIEQNIEFIDLVVSKKAVFYFFLFCLARELLPMRAPAKYFVPNNNI